MGCRVQRPEAAVHDLALVGGVGLERLELRVTDRLEGDADGPQEQTHDGDGGDAAARGCADLDGQRDEPHGKALHEVDLADRDPGGVALLLGQHLLVARVLTLARVAARDVPRQSQPPQGDDHDERQPTPPGPVTDQGGHHGDDDEAETPRRVDDADSALPGADDRGRRHEDDDREERKACDSQEVRPAEGHDQAVGRCGGSPEVPRSGRTARIWSTPMRPSRKAIEAADEVEPPHPCDLLADKGDGTVPVGLEGVVPGVDRADVVLAQRVDVTHLQTHLLDEVDGLADGPHRHVGSDERLDERAAAGVPTTP